MKDFNRKDRGGWKPRRNFGGRDFDREAPEMFQTVCDGCGDECEVPFKPNGRKPVYCKACFRKEEGDEGGRRDRFEQPRFEKPRFEKPRFEKPKFEKPAADYSSQFEMLNFKMDMILKELHRMGMGSMEQKKETKVVKEAKEVKAESKTDELSDFVKEAKAKKTKAKTTKKKA